MRIKVGITGQNGFLGTHLINTLNLSPDLFEILRFERDCFDDDKKLDHFVLECDVLVHLAAINRHSDPLVLHDTNLDLVRLLIASLERVKSKAHVIMSSSSQEDRNNVYGKSKKAGRILFSQWANRNETLFTGLIIPNVFGPFGVPYYNSVVATFCHQLCNNETPTIDIDSSLKLIYVGDLVVRIRDVILNGTADDNMVVKETDSVKVSVLLALLKGYRDDYLISGSIPDIDDSFSLNLFNTFRSYIDIPHHFPVKLKQNIDSRGSFVEILRLGVGGQISFSTTVPGVTRGNHYHTRKIERFAVISGKALIQLRKVGTKETFDFYLDGKNASYVDMPIWYSHNIRNIGRDVLYTVFWINEPYKEEDADTYFAIV
jgi:UDP-2-acetamido-2,6-beta-L-arabino-hexul-4-ose reductase